MTTRLVLDFYSNRILYYTNDPTEQLETNNSVMLLHYNKSLPSDLTLKNCWQYRVSNLLDVVKDNYQTVNALEHNKAAFTRILDQRFQKLKSSTETLDRKKNYLNRLQQLTTDQQILHSKNQFMLRSDADLTGDIQNNVVEYIDYQSNWKEVCNFVLDNISDFDHFQLRQKNVTVQKETQTIAIRNIFLDQGLQRGQAWHSELVKNTDFYEKYKIIVDWVEKFAASQDATIGKLVIAKLKAHGIVYDHEDYGGYYYNRDRYHLVLQGRYLYVVGEDHCVSAEPGMLFWFNNKLKHYAYSVSDEDRISVIFDIKPNDLTKLKSRYHREKFEKILFSDQHYLNYKNQ